MSVTQRIQAVITTLVLTQTIPASGQLYEGRHGFWFGVGVGYGSANISCDDCASGPRVGGFSPFLRIGGTLSPHVRLGAVVDYWTRTTEGQTEAMGNLGATVTYYPDARKGLFLEGGIGLSYYRADVTPDQISGAGSGFALGAGYEIPVGQTIALTPRIAYSYGSVGSLNYSSGSGVFTTGWTQNLLSLGAGLTFH